MRKRIKQSIKSMLARYKNRNINIHWIKKDHNSWLAQNFQGINIKAEKSPFSSKIENLAHKTNLLGAQPLWEGYSGNNIGGATRSPDDVRTLAYMGDLYTYLIKKRAPTIVVEFGTAFGVSGMYFLAGLELNNKGKLLTFEPNELWAKLAKQNLSEISKRYHHTIGTFEENITKALEQNEAIDIAFIDAIHTQEFVIPQLEIVIAHSSKNAIIILDDINFSDNMRACWEKVSMDKRFSASLALGERVGLLELA